MSQLLSNAAYLSRRTFKDIITFIPFVIILLIPLSPIGHVLVFGAIQRFFPDFFPSCFTEQRQNLLQLYENAEYSELTINETWQVSLRSRFYCFICPRYYKDAYNIAFFAQEKLMRLSEAFVYVMVNTFRTIIGKIRGRTGSKADDSSGESSIP
jgi:hypothetical protein